MIDRITRPRLSRYLAFGSFLLGLSILGFAQVAERPRITPTPQAKATPTPAASPSPSATPKPQPTQTIEELQTLIRQRIYAPEVRRGRIGIKIVSLNSGKVVFESDADKYFTPASNMKNFTVAAALEKLGPDFKFNTRVFGPKPDSDGTVKGPLTIVGGGDVSISNAFDPAFPGVVNPYWGIDKLADKIIAAGVKRIEGDLIGNEQHFWGFATPETWEWDDMQTFSGAEVSALPINDNVVDLRIRPAASSSGEPCLISITPANSIVQIVNNCTTVTNGGQNLKVTKRIDQNIIEVSGTMEAGNKDNVRSVTFSHVAQLFINVLKERLESKGITVTGKARTIDNSVENTRPPSGRSLSTLVPNGNQNDTVPIATLESPPFSVVAAKTMKPSQNMYTETILWTLGEEIGRKNGATFADSSHLGLGVTAAFRKEVGIPDDAVIQYDGSGMSRHNVVTPNAVVQLYTYMAKQSKYAQAWRDSLSIGGVDGTLRNRFKGTLAEGNMRGKTGTLDQVSALSGYITTAGGEQLVVSILVNGVAEPRMRTSLIDGIAVDVAKFNGKIDQ